MGTEELIERYLMETDVLNNEDIICAIAYGSRITGSNNINSDLDIVLIKSSPDSYCSKFFIDGITIDSFIYSTDDLQEQIVYDVYKGNSYFESVINSGKVLIDRCSVCEDISESINECKRNKRNGIILNSKLISLMYSSFDEYMNSKETIFEDYYYYATLELIRKIYHIYKSYISLDYIKTIKAYNNPSYFKKQYYAKLPDDEYMESFLSNIEIKGRKERENVLLNAIEKIKEYINIVSLNSKYVSNNASGNWILNKDEIKYKLTTINNKILKVEEMLMNNSQYKDFEYNLLIRDIASFYKRINNKDLDLNEVLSITNDQERINTLENLFHMISNEIDMDFFDYSIKL